MLFKGLSLTFKKDDKIREEVEKFWDTMSSIYGANKLRGLVYNQTVDTIEYAIGFKNGEMLRAEREKLVEHYHNIEYKIVYLPYYGWKEYSGKTKHVDQALDIIKSEGPTKLELHEFSRGKRGRKYIIKVNRRTKFTK